VVADVPGEPRGLLDACVFGFGKPEAEARRNAADEFADSAFPALLSELKQASWLDAQPFSGTEVWGVPGRRGYAGPYYLRGHLQPEEIVDVPLFAGAEELPADGRLHLLKATAYVHDGGWLLTHELDGHATTVSERPWSKWPVPSEFAMIVRFAVFRKRDGLGDQASRDRALSRLDGPGPWRSAPEACIAEVIPKELVDSAYSLEACKGGRLLDCLVECEGGSHNACYSAALELQPIEKLKARSEALFVRACRLGFPSACTNAAADRLGALHVKEDACSTRTFKETCERASDPWACTMYGAVLISGGSAERDLPSARQVLAKSCLHGSDDPACTAAGQLLRMITSQSGNDGG